MAPQHWGDSPVSLPRLHRRGPAPPPLPSGQRGTLGRRHHRPWCSTRTALALPTPTLTTSEDQDRRGPSCVVAARPTRGGHRQLLAGEVLGFLGGDMVTGAVGAAPGNPSSTRRRARPSPEAQPGACSPTSHAIGRWMTGLLRLSRMFEGCSPLWCMAEDALRLNDTVPFTAVGCGCRRPWFTSGSLASSPPVRGSVHLPRWFGRRRCA